MAKKFYGGGLSPLTMLVLFVALIAVVVIGLAAGGVFNPKSSSASGTVPKQPLRT